MKALERFLEWGGVKKDVTLLVISGAALLASAWEFSRWVSVVYPLFGYLGLLQLAVLLASFWKS